MIKKLCNYYLNCIIEAQKTEKIINLKKDKYSKENDNKKIIELKTIQKLNNSTMILYYCSRFYINDAPLFYKEYEKMEEDFKINIGLILKHFENFELLELFLKDIENLKSEKEIINILINSYDFDAKIIEDKKENFIVLAKIQECKAGLIKELKQIVKNY